MNAAGIQPAIYPPPAFGGQVRSGLANLVFAHELPGYGSTEIYQSMLDWCQLTGATLDKRADDLRRKRWNPFYWIDRLLRVVLGIPAYLICLIFQVPVSRINASFLGPILKLISAAGTIAGVYFGGSDRGWW